MATRRKSQDEEGFAALVGHIGRPAVKSRVSECDWNFSKCPANQRSFCQIYEYGRSSPRTVAQVKKWRLDGFARADLPLSANSQLEELKAMDLFRLFPEFPVTPWLDLLPGAVRIRLKSLAETKRLPILVRSVGVERLREDDQYVDSLPVMAPYQTSTIQPLEIVWFYNDKLLLGAFKEWLKVHRPYGAQEMRGKTSPRELLNALSAWRLLKEHTYLEADEITGNVLGKPLFRTQPDWLDAKRQADDVLEGRLPPHPVELLWRRLPKGEFTEDELNALWQHWVTLTAGQARAIRLLKPEVLAKRMREFLRK